LFDGFGVGGVEFGAGSSGAEANLTAFEVGDVDGADVAVGIAGGLVESGGERGAVGDLVELCVVEVVEEDVEAEEVFDDGEGVFCGHGGEGGVVEDEDGDGLAGVDFAGEAGLGEEAVEVAVVGVGGENVGDIVGGGGGGEEGEEEERENVSHDGETIREWKWKWEWEWEWE